MCSFADVVFNCFNDGRIFPFMECFSLSMHQIVTVANQSGWNAFYCPKTKGFWSRNRRVLQWDNETGGLNQANQSVVVRGQFWFRSCAPLHSWMRIPVCDSILSYIVFGVRELLAVTYLTWNWKPSHDNEEIKIDVYHSMYTCMGVSVFGMCTHMHIINFTIVTTIVFYYCYYFFLLFICIYE